MVEKITNFFKDLFFKHIIRKTIALILAILIWFLVDNTLGTTKTFHNIPVKIINLPDGKTIEGLQPNGLMSKKISLILSGRKSFLDRITSSDFEVVVDAGNQPQDEWIVTVSKRNLVPFSSEINLQRDINKVSSKNFIIKLVNLSHDKIPVFITKPIGEPPKGYQFLDVWPYQLMLSVSGPEAEVAKLKSRGIKLTFNLNEITKSELENLPSNQQLQSKDVVSFFVPKNWKQVQLPSITDTPIIIDDPDAKFLRIDFIRSELLPIGNLLPISFFYPTRMLESQNMTQYKFSNSSVLSVKNQVPLLNIPLYAKGVSDLFVQIVKDNIQIVLTFPQKIESKILDWSIVFINPKILEDRYVNLLMSDTAEEGIKELQPEVREKYLRNRFRNYMHRFQLYCSNDKKLDLNAEIKNNNIIITTKNGSN